MKIALLGYGKMGKMIEKAAQERGHEVVLKINSEGRKSLTQQELQKADCVIEFTKPASAVENIFFCLDAGVPVVVGTTGWNEQMENVRKECEEKNGSLIYGSNFSLGVNMLFALNRLLAKWMGKATGYRVEINEEHHVHKLDKPSGTAITLADDIFKNADRFNGWKAYEHGDMKWIKMDEIPIYYLREDEIPGIHQVTWTSGIDEIQLGHKAFNREGFAIGAVLATEFIKDKKGFFTASDMF